MSADSLTEGAPTTPDNPSDPYERRAPTVPRLSDDQVDRAEEFGVVQRASPKKEGECACKLRSFPRRIGDRVAVPWIQASCGRCEWCLRGLEWSCLIRSESP